MAVLAPRRPLAKGTITTGRTYAMATLFKMPMLGNTMEEGTIVQWFKSEGDAVKKGEPLLEVMSDKANFEVESPEDGIVRKLLAAADESVPVNHGIAIIGSADEPIDGLLGGDGASAGPSPAPVSPAAPVAASAPAPPAPSPAPAQAGPVNASPRARKLADEHGVSIADLAGRGTGPGGRIIERDVLALAASKASGAAPETGARVSPLAARIAEDLGVDVASLAAPGERVTAEDVRKAAAGAEAPAVPAAEPAPKAAAPGEPTVVDRIPFRGMRKMVADTVTRSRQTAPHIAINMEVDVTEAMALRERLIPEVQSAYNTKLTFTDLLVKAVARALADHPLCNAALIGDEIRIYGERNIGVAVATDTGLVVPVIRNADQKSLGSVSVELKALVERCRTGKQTQEDLSGGTFTITNLGMFGVDAFDPILVPPQSCILGVCRSVDKPVAINKEVVVRTMMNLSLSIDHRVLDGVPAARFLQRVKELMENPLRIIL